MDVNDLLKKAWDAVQHSGVPPELHEVAFLEAVTYLREPGSADPSGSGKVSTGAKATPATTPPPAGGTPGNNDEDKFFANLAHESGVPEADLRDIMVLNADGSVIVTAPTKDLGKNAAEQSRNITAIVAGARAKGLGEKPVVADAVRAEIKRHGCFQQNNYAGTHLARMKGVNYGATNAEMVLTSKWVSEFTGAVDTAHGRA